jgi:hypothetical protein
VAAGKQVEEDARDGGGWQGFPVRNKLQKSTNSKCKNKIT